MTGKELGKQPAFPGSDDCSGGFTKRELVLLHCYQTQLLLRHDNTNFSGDFDCAEIATAVFLDRLAEKSNAK